MALTRSTEGLSAPLARFFQSILLCSSPYQTLDNEVELPAISWVETFYTHTYLLSFRRSYYLFGVDVPAQSAFWSE